MAAPVEFQYEDIKKYTKNFSEKVNEGGCALVYKGTIHKVNPYNLRKQEVAVKKLMTMKKIQQFENEIRWLEVFQHEGIVRYLGNCRSEEGFFIVLEYIRKTDLAKNINALSWNDTLIILRRVAATIAYIHSFGPNPPAPGHLVIGDLKCQNILLDKGNIPKLCDFGTIDTEGSQLYGFTPFLVDPDAYNRHTIKQRDDLYCLGIIIFQLIMKEEKVMKEGVHIKSLAEEKLRTDPHLVHPDLLQSGCTKSNAVTISELAMKLTQAKKPKEAPPDAQNVFKKAVEKGRKMEGKREEGKKKKGEKEEEADEIQEAIGNEGENGSEKMSVSSEEGRKKEGKIEEEGKKKKGEIEEEEADEIQEAIGNEGENGSGRVSVSSEEGRKKEGKIEEGKKKKGEIEEEEADEIQEAIGNEGERESVSSEEPDRENIQDAIVTLESLTLQQSKSNRARATEKLEKWFNWLKSSVSQSRN